MCTLYTYVYVCTLYTCVFCICACVYTVRMCIHCVHVCILYMCMCEHCVHVYTLCMYIHCVHVYMCVYTVCGCEHCGHVEASSQHHISFFIIFHFMFLRHHWSWCSSIQHDWVIGKSRGSSLSPYPRSRITGTHCCAQLFMQVLGIQTKTLGLVQLAFYFQRFSYTPGLLYLVFF